MRKNLYALLLLILLCLLTAASEWYVAATAQELTEQLRQAYACSARSDYESARLGYLCAAQSGAKMQRTLRLCVRRSILDKISETLATLPSYAQKDNASDLAVETARAIEQLHQMRESFIAVF